MHSTRRWIGVAALAMFALMAGSVICFASGMPAAMADCGGQMSAAAVCPFMSVSVPAVTKAAPGNETAMMFLVLVLAMAVGFGAILSRQDAAPQRPGAHQFQGPPLSFLDSVIRLISAGILHARVFAW